jgi:hypothetical protein
MEPLQVPTRAPRRNKRGPPLSRNPSGLAGAIRERATSGSCRARAGAGLMAPRPLGRRRSTVH